VSKPIAFDERGNALRTERDPSQALGEEFNPCTARLGRRGQTFEVIPEAPLRVTKNGLVVDGEGWFIANARESRWKDEGPLGSYCTFEGKRRFPQLGINISVLEPGEAMPWHTDACHRFSVIVRGVRLCPHSAITRGRSRVR